MLTLPPDLDIPPAVLRERIRSANLPAGAPFGADFRSEDHALGPDKDVLFTLLAGQIASPGNPFVGNDFESGGRRGTPRAEPEPAALAPWTLTLAVVGALARCRPRARPGKLYRNP
jgi:hypothetical protein